MMLHKQNERSGNRPGFTMIEILGVMAALTICLMLGATLLATVIKAAQAGEAASDRASRRQELASQFRDDVARAATAPEKLGDIAASPTCLILPMPGDLTILYRWKDNVLTRVERKGDHEVARPIAVGPKAASVEFVRPANNSGLVTIRLNEASGKQKTTRTELAAALGGNLR